MANEYSFRFSLPRPRPRGRRVSAGEALHILQDRLQAAETNEEAYGALWELVRFHSLRNRQDVAMECVERMLALTDDCEQRATCILTMGQLMEQMEDFAAAARFYRRALSLEPASTESWYFIHNNLGFCLNLEGRHAEAEPLCRAATRIDPERPNAWKNLGISLAGLDRPAHAAACWIRATHVEASDRRAFDLLDALVAEHPALRRDLQAELACCREAVTLAARARSRLQGGDPDAG